MKNREIHLKHYPQGLATEDDFELVETELPELGDREILVKNIYLSVDPYMFGQMIDSDDSYIDPYIPGEAMTGDAVGEVIASNHSDYATGELVAHFEGWREYAIVKVDDYAKPGPEAVDQLAVLRKVDTSIAPASAFIGALGMPGITAYGGIVYAGEIKAGETVFVSGSAGAVGSLVGQIAKNRACKVIGSAGSEEKVRMLKDELGFDEAFNYKTEAPEAALPRLVPEGIDVYFDNVGGDHLEAATQNIRPWGRIVECGYIQDYGDSDLPPGPKDYWGFLALNVTIRGLLAPGYYDKYEELYNEVGGLIKAGKVKIKETIYEGLERMPEAYCGLFKGANTGKMLIKV